MSKDAILHVRMDPQEKQAAEEIFARMGTSLSEATRVFVHECVRSHGLPFMPSTAPVKGQGRAQGVLAGYADSSSREKEREAWIRSLRKSHESFTK